MGDHEGGEGDIESCTASDSTCDNIGLGICANNVVEEEGGHGDKSDSDQTNKKKKKKKTRDSDKSKKKKKKKKSSS